MRTIWNAKNQVGKVMLINRKVCFFMIFVNDDTRTSDKMSFAVNAKPHGLSEAEKETVTAAAEGLVSVFEADMPGQFGGIFVYESISDKDVDVFIFETGDDWFLLISSFALQSAFLKSFVAEAFATTIQFGPETSVDLVRLGSKT